MKALFLKTLDGDTVINLDNVTHIEFDSGGAASPSLDIWLVGSQSPIRFPLAKGIKAYHVMDRLKEALKPLYDGRQGTIMGIELGMNIMDFQSQDGFLDRKSF